MKLRTNLKAAATTGKHNEGQVNKPACHTGLRKARVRAGAITTLRLAEQEGTMLKSRRTRCVLAAFSTVLLLGVVSARAQTFIAPPESFPGGLSYPHWSA